MTADINGADGKEGQLEQIYKQRWFADFWMECLHGVWNAAHVH